MQLYYIGIIRIEPKPAYEVCAEKNLSSFSRFTRTSYGEFMTATAKIIAERTRPGQRLDVDVKDSKIHSYYRSGGGVCGIIISGQQYPNLVAHQLLNKIVDEFLTQHPPSSWVTDQPALLIPELKAYLVKYQDPLQADSILKIHRDVNETKIIIHKSTESVVERDENIDDLMIQSEDLSTQSKLFYQQAKKENSCCVLM
ncbi:putative snare protein [Ilyonectria destructans]|nr:putative snare protein [Ilyonectria destructans]